MTKRFTTYYLPLILAGALIFASIGFWRIHNANAAITMDTSANSGVTSADINGNASFTYTTGSGLSNSILVLAVDWQSATTMATSTYAGVPLTRIDGAANGSTCKTEMWYVLNPTAGANTLAVHMSGQTLNMGLSVITLTGVDQTTPVETFASSTGTSLNPSVSFTTTTANDWLVAALCYGGANAFNVVTADSPRTTFNKYDMNTKQTVQGRYEGFATPGAATMPFTSTGTARAYSEVGVAFKPAGAGGGGGSSSSTPAFVQFD